MRTVGYPGEGGITHSVNGFGKSSSTGIILFAYRDMFILPKKEKKNLFNLNRLFDFHAAKYLIWKKSEKVEKSRKNQKMFYRKC